MNRRRITTAVLRAALQVGRFIRAIRRGFGRADETLRPV